ncbi:MAG: ATP-binding protein [Coxiellaceae bacterium]|nr:ATP-binding protein [Coxiellaceae bacterium]
MDFIENFFSTNGFMPHGMCLQWKPAILWCQVFSDAIITLAYFLIPIALIYLVIKRKDIKFRLVFVLFGAFIVFCGVTHLVAMIAFWDPIYGIQAVIKACTAIVSILTAIAVWALVPKILKMPSLQSLEESNKLLIKLNIELKMTQKRNELLLESAGEGIYGLNTKGEVTFINQKALDLIGFSKDEIMGKIMHSITHYAYPDGSPYPREKCNMYASYQDGKTRKIDDEVLWRKDGSCFPCEYTSTPIKINNTIEGAVIIFKDISDRKDHEDSMKQLTESLQKANKELDEFCYIASHDLKEPLRGITTYTMFLLEDYADALDTAGKDRLITLQDLSNKMSLLIDQLLQYSRVGRSEVNLEQVDLVEIINDKKILLKAYLDENNVTVSTPNEMPLINCDKVLIAEVIQNLITNAIKYNANDHKTIDIAASIKNNLATITLKDNGIGIDERHLEDIFKLFKRLHPDNKYAEGSGAGLTFVKKIIERHSGKVWVESEVGVGSTFYIELPQH